MPIRGGRAYWQHTTFKARIRERDGQLVTCVTGTGHRWAR